MFNYIHSHEINVLWVYIVFRWHILHTYFQNVHDDTLSYNMNTQYYTCGLMSNIILIYKNPSHGFKLKLMHNLYYHGFINRLGLTIS